MVCVRAASFAAPATGTRTGRIVIVRSKVVDARVGEEGKC